MRRAYKNVGIVRDAGVTLLSFGYDFCSEHEWGIKGIQSTFGIGLDQSDLTIGCLAITRVSNENLFLTQGKDGNKKERIYLIGSRGSLYKDPREFATKHYDSYCKVGEHMAHWDERGFMYSVPAGGDDEQALRDIYQAFATMDVLIYLASSGTPFGGSGLVVARRSTLPKDRVEQMEEGFREKDRLLKASDATGIKDRVDRSRYFGLSPRWISEDRAPTSQYPVMYWLNPYDQANNSAGYFTVEELDLWLEGKGPIPKKAAHG